MKEVQPSVSILSHTENPLETIYRAARQCYSAGSVIDMEPVSREKMAELVQRCIRSGHTSVLEHVSFTFAISGVSRALSHQLVRHRMASYCVAGDTKISTSSQRTNKKTIEELYNLPLMYKKQIKARCVDEKTGLIGYNKVKNIIYSGKKQVYSVVTGHGYQIKATLEHMFFTSSGWKKLKNIQVGDKVYINGIELYKDRDWLYKAYSVDNLSQKEIAEICGVSKHTIRSWVRHFCLQKPLGSWCIGKTPPNAGKSKETYAPLMSASKKMMGNKNCKPENMTGERNHRWKGDNVGKTGGYCRTHRSFKRTEKCELCGFNGVTELHHKDKNPCNTSKDNVIELCISCHKAIHKKEIRERIVLSEVMSIKPFGFVDTYDIEMCEPHHNFIANGFVVHNSQQSQRYVKIEELEYVCPPSLRDETSADRAYFLDSLERAVHAYQAMVADGVPAEDARFVLPNATATNIVMTMNCRALLHFLEERCCNKAQWEIRELAWSMRHKLVKILPEVFETVGPKCWHIGYCPEDRGCGFFAKLGK